MPAFSPIVIADGQATPVNHTFAPSRIDMAGVSRWEDRSGGIALGFPVLTFSMRAPSPSTKGARAYRMTAKVVTPVLEQTSASTSTGIQPAPTKAYDLIAEISFVIPERSTLAQRTDLLAYVNGLLAHTGNFASNMAYVKPAVLNFEAVY